MDRRLELFLQPPGGSRHKAGMTKEGWMTMGDEA
jgi:hypothetical protein